MAKFIDLGVKKADDPIYTEGISIISIHNQPKPPTPLPIQNQESKIKNHLTPPPTPPTSTPRFTPKRFKGIDYTQHPQSYWADSSVLHATLRNVKGENRRRLIRDFHSLNQLDQVEPGLSKDTLTTPERQSLGRIHPSFLGGEYLPDYQTAETEIARIVLDSTLRDVISLRARRTKTGLLRYSIVDEYEGIFVFPKLPSRDPLTFGQIVDWIDQTRLEDYTDDSYGLGLTYTESNHRESELADRLEYFTTVESELYPQLTEHYRKVSSEWVFQKFLEHEDGKTRARLITSLIEEGKATDEADATAILKEHGF